MVITSRFRPEALERHRRPDGLGPALGAEPGLHRPVGLQARIAAFRSSVQWLSRRHRIPVCLQTQSSDCGPACLVMALRYHQLPVSLDTVRAQADAGRNGASARTLLELARGFGLPGRGVRVDLDGLKQLSPGAILFWNFNHFVVLESASRDYVDIVDPAFGPRRLSRASVAEAFTGVALEFDAPLGRSQSPAAVEAHAEPDPWQRLREFLPRGRELGGLATTSFVLMAFELVLPLTTSYLVGHVLPKHASHPLGLVAAGLAAISVLFVVMQLLRSFMVTKRQAVIEKRLTWGVVEHLATLPYDYFTARNSGDLAMRIRAGALLNQVLSLSAVSAGFDSILIVVYLVAIVFANAVLAGVVIGLIALQVAIMVITWRRQVDLGQEVLERQTKAQEELVEMLESMTTLKSSGLEGRAVERWSHALVDEVNKRLRARRSLAVATSLSQGVQFLAPLLVLTTGGFLVLNQQMSLGSALAFMSLTIALFIPLGGMFDVASQLAMIRPTLARLDDVLRAESEPRGERVGHGVEEPGRIRAQGVSFRYPGAGRPTLSGIDLHIDPGQFVVVVGRSGSGKTTLGMLLAGLRLPSEGTILIDGTDLRELDRPTYRRQIGYVNQNAHLFGGSIRDNIALGSEDTGHDALVDAVRAAGIHEEIVALPMGYETLVGPGGHGLSGGQRQRIVLARALVRQPRLMIFDEATSALDPALEKEIFTGLLKLGITVVVIAHRLTVLEEADQVIVLRDGLIVEAGRPADLKHTGGEFRCLS